MITNWIYKLFEKQRLINFSKRIPSKINILGMLRIRNEELIIEDTLNHLSTFCDAIVCFDDNSTDNTYSIISKHSHVIAIIRNFNWLSGVQDRLESETSHRADLLKLSKTFNPRWIFCADADERYIGDIKGFTNSEDSENLDIIRISLFDAYMTKDDSKPYSQGTPLLNFRTHFGPERRDIVMLWRNNEFNLEYIGLDSREPKFQGDLRLDTRFFCQHYGKSLSVDHWESTCTYYVNHFPYESYGKKWEERRGKALHTESDFGRELYTWGQQLFDNSIKIYP
ncbi:hypothetical protein GC102_19490 [Paenibacillus sp. LMG 31460]|uniref:Glycosyl transferase family 2 n=1 Tax=Paenibacillus germinis TaxID=2654979 RepID=A0ABX1Z6M1_9BACL|nr:glycosyltransferase family 2 protein [Paenibacillus germinis]NOU87934.1 hypothetical protein [Paenibacillus germinis]